jgi:ABC-type uncharacterized transport system substrate-binding protein
VAAFSASTDGVVDEMTAAGGLIGYGANVTDQHRIRGVYAGRILKGEKPAELPLSRTNASPFLILSNVGNPNPLPPRG